MDSSKPLSFPRRAASCSKHSESKNCASDERGNDDNYHYGFWPKL